MSSKIKMTWVCPACDTHNQQETKKPTPYGRVTMGVTCSLCENDFTMQVVKAKQPGQVGYVFIDGPRHELSESEVAELLLKRDQQLAAEDDAQNQKENE